jgi:hypothetical protein
MNVTPKDPNQVDPYFDKPEAKANDKAKKSSGPRNVDVGTLLKHVQNSNPSVKAAFRLLKSESTTQYSEPAGLDYKNIFKSIGEFFSRVNKFLQESALSIRKFIGKVEDWTKGNNEVVKTSEVKLSESSESKSIKLATSNVGMDGVYYNLNVYLSDFGEDQQFNEKYLKPKFQKLEPFMEKDKLPEGNFVRQQLSILLKDNKGSSEFTGAQKEALSLLVEHLSDLKNRQEFKAVCEGCSLAALLDGMSNSIFPLYHFSKIHTEWKTEGGDSSLAEYVKNKTDKLMQERIDQIKDKDVCFLQEFTDDSVFGEKVKGENIALFTSLKRESIALAINKNRFEVIDYPRPENAEKSKKTDDFVEDRIEGKLLRVYDDGSFGRPGVFRAVIATDKTNGKKMLFCSVHLIGYGIGKNEEGEEKAFNSVDVMQNVIDKIAADQSVDGIVIGGDFNSVKKNVGGWQPLNPLKQAEYEQVPVKSDTEVSYGYQEGYKLSRKIDHLFVKWLSEGEGLYLQVSKTKVSQGNTGKLDVTKQTLFDHETVSTEIQIKQSWLKMQMHRFFYQKPEPRAVDPESRVVNPDPNGKVDSSADKFEPRTIIHDGEPI